MSSWLDQTLSNYNPRDITIATIGSHSALQILRGAKQEGLKTLAFCEKDKAHFYETFGVADKIVIVEDYGSLLKEENRRLLLDYNAIFIPNGSFLAYIGSKRIENEFKVPLFGNRRLLRVEEDRVLELNLLSTTGAAIPKEVRRERLKNYKEPVFVKYSGPRGGASHFLERGLSLVGKRIGKPREYRIEEYVIGSRFYIHFFRSIIRNRVELLGMDERKLANIDGLTFIPASLQPDLIPTYLVTGNDSVVMRESIAPKALELGEKLVEASTDLDPKGLIGPYAVHVSVDDQLKFKLFGLAMRIDGGSNSFADGSPYGYALFGEPMGMGRRAAREIREAAEIGRLREIVT